MNKFVVFEGLDGVGKTTLIKEFCKRTGAIHVSETMETIKVYDGNREYTIDNSYCAGLMKFLSKPPSQTLADSTSHSLLVSSARRSCYINVIKPLLDRGLMVAMDRFYLSTYFNYQRDCKKNASIYNLAMEDLFVEDFFLVLVTATKEKALSRVMTRGNADIYDIHAFAKYEEIQADYINHANKIKNKVIINNNEDIISDEKWDEYVEEIMDKLYWSI